MKRLFGILAALAVLTTSCGGNDDPIVENEAPVLVSSSPQDGTKLSKLSGGTWCDIVFTYDQKIQCTSDTQKIITVDNDASVSDIKAEGNDLTVTLAHLQYGLEYTVSIPEGFVEGLHYTQKKSAAVEFHFSVEEFTFEGVPVEIGDDNGSFSRLYILNEGSYPGVSTLDMLDLKNKKYCTDIFAQSNPQVVQGLGNTGNDMAIFHDALYVLMNASNMVAKLSLPTAEMDFGLQVDSPRCVTQDDEYAYFTSFGGAVYGGETPVVGKVYRLDGNFFESLEVGYQPEGLGILDGKLYVANSGGYNYVHDNRISVIDLSSFTVEKTIEAPVTNLFQVCVASGKVWVSSYGESTWTQDSEGNWNQSVSAPQSLTSVDPDGTCKIIEGVHSDKMTLCGKTIYCFGNDDEMTGGYNICLYKIDTENSTFEKTSFAGSDLSRIIYPYGILVNPDNGDIYICDASFTGGSKVHCFNASLKHKWTVDTGVGTGHLLLQ